MTGQTKTLLVIAAFVVVTLASFIWFIVTWDPAREEPVVRAPLPETSDTTA